MNPTKRPDRSPSTQLRRGLRKVRPEMSWEILVARPSAGLPGDPGIRALCVATPPGPGVGAAASAGRLEPQSPEAAAPGREGQTGAEPAVRGADPADPPPPAPPRH